VVHANIIGVSPWGSRRLGRYGIYFDINTRNQTADSNIIRNAAGGGSSWSTEHPADPIGINIISDGPGISCAR
jgi:hypothetical protein